MKIAALIFGILAGLSTLPLASYAHALIGLGGGKDGSLLYLLPILSFVGGGIALSMPAAAATLLGLCAVALLFIGGQFGYAINIITIGPVVLNSVGALLAFIGYSSSQSDLTVGIARTQNNSLASPKPPESVSQSGSPYEWTPTIKTRHAEQFDRVKWNALVKYDADIGRVEGKVRQLGEKWVDVFAADYLALGDKSYLPAIIKKILEQAKLEQEAANELRQRKQQEEQLERAVKQRAIEEREEQYQNRIMVIKSSLWGTHLRKAVSLVFTASAVSAIAFYTWNYQSMAPTQSIGGSLATDAVREAFLSAIRSDNPDNIKPRKTTVSGSYALQSWGGDVTGGAALLRYDRWKNKWTMVEIGGGAWSQSELVRMRVPPETAAMLLAEQK